MNPPLSNLLFVTKYPETKAPHNAKPRALAYARLARLGASGAKDEEKDTDQILYSLLQQLN